MPSRVVATIAVVESVLGVALIFFPSEAARLLFPETAAPPVVLSLIGAALFGFGQLNWMTREAPMGGIYGRPVVMANLVHFVVGGLALLRAAETTALWAVAAFYLAGAVFYGALLLRSPGLTTGT